MLGGHVERRRTDEVPPDWNIRRQLYGREITIEGNLFPDDSSIRVRSTRQKCLGQIQGVQMPAGSGGLPEPGRRMNAKACSTDPLGSGTFGSAPLSNSMPASSKYPLMTAMPNAEVGASGVVARRLYLSAAGAV